MNEEIKEVIEELRNAPGKAFEMAKNDDLSRGYEYPFAFGALIVEVEFLARKLERIVNNAESKAD